MKDDESAPISLNGVLVHRGALPRDEQEVLVSALREVVGAAPFFRPETRRGQQLSVRMTSAGALGWTSDRRGYRYEPNHPKGTAWPEIPNCILDVWCRFSGADRNPDSCLVNYYGDGARMGLHQDRDEDDLTWPVVSISLGDDALFRVGGTTRSGPTRSIWLSSGDVAILAGPARLAYHGIDRIRLGSSELLKDGGRLNVTLRVAGPSASRPS